MLAAYKADLSIKKMTNLIFAHFKALWPKCFLH